MKARLDALIHPPSATGDEETYPAVPLLTDVREAVE
jgi:hypothetical protein